MEPASPEEFRVRLQTTLGSTYTLEHELSGGAMSRVFAATETALGRRVVVKVLSPELAEGVSADRFAREIKFAASLQQANIVPVLTTGAIGGLPFYTMPFVDGSSLRERLKRGTVSAREAIGILRDVTRALAYAHDRGVVHRDVKPENVLLSGDAAVVTDFGIAKAISVARGATDATATGLTRAGMAVGTPAYMSPEQISGDSNADQRADIYSLGCLAYELFAGTPPFYGRGVHEMFAAHLAQLPVPIEDVRRDCPPAIAQLIMRCLEKSPANRPQNAREVLEALDNTTTPPSGSHAMRRMPLGRVAAIAAGVVLVTAIGAVAVKQYTGPAEARSIAVLPIANVGGDSAQEYLADGMTDELSTAIGKLTGVRVASRSLARRYRSQRDVDVRDVGRTLGVSYVLQGTLRMVGGKLRVGAQLTNAADGVELWSDIYDRDAAAVFALQDDITRGVAGALKLEQSDATVHSPRGTTDPEAYDLYLRGRFLLERRGVGVRQSIDHFERAIQRDSGFARAYAGASMALELLPYFSDASAQSVTERANTMARRALMLDSTLAEARIALGLAAMLAWKWQAAGDELRHAIALAPNEQSAHLQYARYLAYTGKLAEARAQLETAKRLDPSAALPSAWLGEVDWLTGDTAASLAETRRALELDSLNGPALQFGALTFARAGDRAQSLRVAGRLPVSLIVWEGAYAAALSLAGDRASAQGVVSRLERNSDAWFARTSLSLAYLALGDTARALTQLEKATDRAEMWTSFTPLSDPLFDGVRHSARFAALLRRVHLEDAGFTAPLGGRARR